MISKRVKIQNHKQYIYIYNFKQSFSNGRMLDFQWFYCDISSTTICQYTNMPIYAHASTMLHNTNLHARHCVIIFGHQSIVIGSTVLQICSVQTVNLGLGGAEIFCEINSFLGPQQHGLEVLVQGLVGALKSWSYTAHDMNFVSVICRAHWFVLSSGPCESSQLPIFNVQPELRSASRTAQEHKSKPTWTPTMGNTPGQSQHVVDPNSEDFLVALDLGPKQWTWITVKHRKNNTKAGSKLLPPEDPPLK